MFKIGFSKKYRIVDYPSFYIFSRFIVRHFNTYHTLPYQVHSDTCILVVVDIPSLQHVSRFNFYVPFHIYKSIVLHFHNLHNVKCQLYTVRVYLKWNPHFILKRSFKPVSAVNQNKQSIKSQEQLDLLRNLSTVQQLEYLRFRMELPAAVIQTTYSSTVHYYQITSPMTSFSYQVGLEWSLIPV